MAYTTIDDPSAYFTITLYTGDGNDNRAITNSANAGDFQPDWLWYKERSSTSSHRVFDSSRGASKRLEPDVANAEATDTSNHKSFDTNGFTVGTSGSTNANGDTYVAWQWKANGGTTASNTDGSITSTVQANTTAGFSIVTYTGTGSTATVGHGLGAKPDVYIVKTRSESQEWMGYFNGTASDPETDGLRLDTTDAITDAATFWNDTAPTSSVFTVNTSNNVNKSSATYVAYCFTSIQGYSKFGGYTGNGSTDGPFIYTGFKPAWILYKGSTLAENWIMNDTKRDPHNLTFHRLDAERNNAESTNTGSTNPIIDILSNGFKIRGSGNVNNGSGATYIYMAFAEHPFVSSEGVPVTAR